MRKRSKETRKRKSMMRKQVGEYLGISGWYQKIPRMGIGGSWLKSIVSTVMISFFEGWITGCVVFAIWACILRNL